MDRLWDLLLLFAFCAFMLLTHAHLAWHDSGGGAMGGCVHIYQGKHQNTASLRVTSHVSVSPNVTLLCPLARATFQGSLA
jgi:hypothetical protein